MYLCLSAVSNHFASSAFGCAIVAELMWVSFCLLWMWWWMGVGEVRQLPSKKPTFPLGMRCRKQTLCFLRKRQSWAKFPNSIKLLPASPALQMSHFNPSPRDQSFLGSSPPQGPAVWGNKLPVLPQPSVARISRVGERTVTGGHVSAQTVHEAKRLGAGELPHPTLSPPISTQQAFPTRKHYLLPPTLWGERPARKNTTRQSGKLRYYGGNMAYSGAAPSYLRRAFMKRCRIQSPRLVVFKAFSTRAPLSPQKNWQTVPKSASFLFLARESACVRVIEAETVFLRPKPHYTMPRMDFPVSSRWGF